uniref:Uncharacterized protein n=1 Tax=Glossina pallidipes TaxID=7398 RepID=A0A1A9Z646_GLOPL
MYLQFRRYAMSLFTLHLPSDIVIGSHKKIRRKLNKCCHLKVRSVFVVITFGALALLWLTDETFNTRLSKCMSCFSSKTNKDTIDYDVCKYRANPYFAEEYILLQQVIVILSTDFLQETQNPTAVVLQIIKQRSDINIISMRKYAVRSYITSDTCLVEYPVFCQSFASIFQDCIEMQIT